MRSILQIPLDISIERLRGTPGKGEAQKQLSKELVREWLISNGFQGLEGQSA